MSIGAIEGRFHIGQLVYNPGSGYRGVVCDVDPVFMLGDRRYDRETPPKPPRYRPWYHVLVDGDDREAYVAERSLIAMPGRVETIDHPDLGLHFVRFENGRYWPILRFN